MITSHEVLEQTGIKSAKTLTRWHRSGIIPEPAIRTHPSGRGKIAYYPDSVVEHIQKIQELRKQGHTLHSAVFALNVARAQETYEYVKERRSFSEFSREKHVRLSDGSEAPWIDIWTGIVLKHARPFLADRDAKAALVAALRDTECLDHAMIHIKGGYSPVLVFDGRKAEVTTDIMLAHRMSADGGENTACLVLPLFKVFKEIYEGIGLPCPPQPIVFPASKVVAKHGDALVEYSIYRVSDNHFELLRETAKTIGTLGPRKEPADEEDDSE